MDFKEMKERIKLVDVLLHYGVRLRRKWGDDYASVACPLPTHPKDDRGNNCFGVHLPSNRWQCKHPDCGAENGVGYKWGDCINLVMTMDKIGAKQAAIQIDGWFPNKNPAPLSEARDDGKAKRHPPHHIPDNTSPAVAVNYMASIDQWFDELVKPLGDESEADYWARLRKQVKNKLVESFNAGKKAGK